MQIRKLEKGDASALRECRLFGLEESPEAFLVTYDEVSGMPLSDVESELTHEHIHYVGAFIDEKLVGFMRFVRFHRQARQHVAGVRSVYVRKDWRGQGVGAALLRRLIDDANSARIESLQLCVLANNPAARRLYESCGFKLYGTEPQAIKKADRYTDLALYVLMIASV